MKFKPLAASSISELEPGTTAMCCIPTRTTAKNTSFGPEGKKMHFTGNQTTKVQRVTEAMDPFASEPLTFPGDLSRLLWRPAQAPFTPRW